MGGLSYDANEHEIKDFFQKERLNPMRVRMLTDPTGKFKGAAFVEFDREDDASNACRLDGKEMGSQRRRVRINPAGSRGGK
jgi:RNA recognition motif-containing protein